MSKQVHGHTIDFVFEASRSKMWEKIVLFLVVCNFLSEGCPPPLSQEDLVKFKDGTSNRLPTNIRPIKYTVVLEPHLRDGVNSVPLNGSVLMEFVPNYDTNNITLHKRQITIEDQYIEVTSAAGIQVPITSTTWDDGKEFFVVNVGSTLQANNTYFLNIRQYNGTLKTDNAGFYLAKYIDESGKVRSFGTTQFQSTNARKAFPCLDEPSFKANFSVTLIRSANYTSISNEVPIVNGRYIGNGKYEDVYAESVKMSPYLVAFVVSDYGNISKQNHRLFARPQAIKEGLADYALDAGIQIINAFSQYLSVNYSLRKMDQIAITDSYFAPGAMENWGLVTYRESYLLYSNETSTTNEKQKTLTIIGHEFGHQWFGNLVTLNWWRYLWLNEGFASYLEYLGPSIVEPSWRLMDQFVILDLQYAFEYDSMNNTEPMNYENEYGGGAPTWVSYQKGASVIRMMAHFVTENVFQKGLTLYLNRNQYRSTVPSDLYEAIQEVLDNSNNSNLGQYNLSTIMTSWTDQKGYPVVNINIDYNTGSTTLIQQRFSLKNDTELEAVWYVPINFVVGPNELNFQETTPEIWFTNKSLTLTKTYPEDGWILANRKLTGFYRVNYDEQNWKRISNYLNSENFANIDVLNRAQILDDSFNLARAGMLSYSVPLKLALYLQRERDHIPTYAFLKAATYLNNILASNPKYDSFKQYMIDILSPIMEYLQFEESISDSHLDKFNRVNVMNWLCELGDSNCRNSALTIFRAWKQGQIEKISSNMQSPTYCGAMRVANQEDWNFLLDSYIAATRSNVRERTLKALGCSEDIPILNSFMDLIRDNSTLISTNDQYTAFRSVYSSGKIGLETAFNYLVDNLTQLKSIISVSSVIIEIGGKFSNEQQLEQLRSLQSMYPDFESAITSAVVKTEENIAWSSKNSEQILDVLDSYLIKVE